MKETNRLIVVFGVSLAALFFVWKLVLSHSSVTETTSGTDKSESPRQGKPPTIQTTQPAVPPESVLEGKDSPLVASAKALLPQADGPERTRQWQQILDQADYHTLVRMTEIPAGPKLTEERKALRLLAIRQLGKVGKLGELIRDRQVYDKDNLSYVQQGAWQEWAKTNPTAALGAWQARVSELAPKPPNNWLIENVVIGLKEADPEIVLEALAGLPEPQRNLFYKQLAKATQATAPAIAEAWAALVTTPKPAKSTQPAQPAPPP